MLPFFVANRKYLCYNDHTLEKQPAIRKNDMMHSLNFLLSNVVPMPRDVGNFFKEHEIVPTTMLEDEDVAEETASIFPIKENVEFLSSPIDVEPNFEVKKASTYAQSMNDFVADTFSPVKVFVRKEALMRKIVILASENKEDLPYQIKVSHTIFDTLDKMNQVDATKFEQYAIDNRYLLSDEIAYQQDVIWNTL